MDAVEEEDHGQETLGHIIAAGAVCGANGPGRPGPVHRGLLRLRRTPCGRPDHARDASGTVPGATAHADANPDAHSHRHRHGDTDAHSHRHGDTDAHSHRHGDNDTDTDAHTHTHAHAHA